MKKLVAVLILGASAALGVHLAGGFDGALAGARQLVADLDTPSPQPPAPASVEPVVEEAQQSAAPVAQPAPVRARIKGSGDGPPQERLTEEDRSRLDQLIGERLGASG